MTDRIPVADGAPPRPNLPFRGPPVPRAERMAHGRTLRNQVPRRAHAAWEPASDRPDPVAILQQGDDVRLPALVPVRYSRMVASPFAFYRGAAAIMAHDLAATPRSGLLVQACGDAHLLNFGLFATPERNLVFDVNDFDETLPGPWEWDVKRLAASVAVAAREGGFDRNVATEMVRECLDAYRFRMATFAEMSYLDTFYAHIDADSLLPLVGGNAKRNLVKGVRKARSRTSLQAAEKLTTIVNGRRQIVSDPPVLLRLEAADFEDQLLAMYVSYNRSLSEERRELLDRYRFVDFAFKVVGVGSVGTRCCIVLFEGADNNDLLILQFKQAMASVIEPFVGASTYANSGQRVVEGQRRTQAASDIFLGWGAAGDGVHYYFRQFRDMKGSFELDQPRPTGMAAYARLCGWALARAHARTGDAAAVTGYLGTAPRFDEAVATFASSYADQNERDHAALQRAVRDGRVEVTEEA